MTNWLLNSAVLTTYGDYSFVRIPREEARRLLQAEPFTSAIGHAATAAVMSEQLGIDVPLNRIQIAMDVADKAIVFRLRDRLPEHAVLNKAELMILPSEFGLLTRVE